MNHYHKRRLYYVCLFMLGLFIAVALILYSLKQNINVFLTPKQITSRITPGYHFRLGGMVKPHTLRHEQNLRVSFIVTDLHSERVVRYEGVLPDLFREGKGVIAEGSLNSKGEFIAGEVLAKHDENYMPKNVYKAIREGTTV